MNNNIDIIMTTYNSGLYLEAQIISILNQTYTYWNIIISDDHSSDNTLDILYKYKNQYNNFFIYQNDTNIGAKNNFIKALKYSTAPYIMFSDHDDIWFENKIEITINKMHEIEQLYGKDTPLLVFTDKTVTDKNLNVVSKSHSRLEKFNVNDFSINKLLMQNSASGCTMMINRKLLEKYTTLPDTAIMHDYWFMLTASIFGHIEYIDTPTMYYRQHSSNELGAKKYNFKYIINKFLKGRKFLQETFYKNIYQAKDFYSKYNTNMTEKEKYIFQQFISLEHKSGLEFISTVWKNNFYKSGIFRNLGLYFAFICK